MSKKISGIHHITSIAGPPQQNVDFYVGQLGLRLVKKTVNFDDEGTYHLYYGNEAGSPGSILTFFPWQDSVPGRAGKGMTSAVAYTTTKLDFWMERFAEAAHSFDGPAERFGDRVISLADPDGLRLELIRPGTTAPSGGTAFHSCTLSLSDIEPTAHLLTNVFGYEHIGEEKGRIRFKSASGAAGEIVDLIQTDERGRPGTGTVHHVAFRARDDEEQLYWQEELSAMGLHVTDIKDRKYFRSIYFREPGGVLFEIATDGPGFSVDEEPEALGSSLMLPPWLEKNRERIELRLPNLHVPERVGLEM